LTEKTEALGNYNHKYLHIISTNINRLTTSLEQQGKLDRVHLWSYSTEIPGEMDTVLEAASDTGEALNFLGCYFALQFLHMNLRMIDILKLELAIGTQRTRTGRKFMLEAGRMFRFLTKCYMKRLLDIFLDKQDVPEFAILGVGTRSDQDDIDLGIVHREQRNSENLNKAIGRLAGQMFKTATKLHFHISEHVGKNSLTAGIEDYEAILDNNSYDFVIVTEMLGAANILGSQGLYEEFKSKVTDRFYHDPRKGVNMFHEGYIRSILGEIPALVNRPKLLDTINPKEDGLRPIKVCLTALKLVYGIDKVNAWDIIDELREKNQERRDQYDEMERTLSFFELFRHLYQIMVAQDEDITLQERCIEDMVAKIAEMIGFRNKGVVKAEDFMLVTYYELLENSIQAIDVLTDDLKKHLRKVSVYKPIFSGEFLKKDGFTGNLSLDFIRSSTFSGGITYWDDFLEELGRDDGRFHSDFITSFLGLTDEQQDEVAGEYIKGIRHNTLPVLKFLVTLGGRAKGREERSVFDAFSSHFIEKLKEHPGAVTSLIQMSDAYSEILNAFLALLDWESLSEFMELVGKRPAVPELVNLHEQLLALINVHSESSYFFKRHFHTILNKYPVFIKNLHKNYKLKEIATGFYSDLTSLSTPAERMERLGDYYDMEFVRVSLLTMAGAPCEHTDAEFIEFCDNYTTSLYEFCVNDVHLSLGYSLHTHDLFALYATGGHAREQAFDDDYDMIVILDSPDQGEIDYCNKIVARMNSHILKRGILPHHRFADRFGSYVVSLDRLAEYLSKEDENVFVDLCQVLSSRMLVGSSKLESRLQEKIIDPCIFAKRGRFIDFMRMEMETRHEDRTEKRDNNIKECRGGLRDIEMLMLMYKAKYGVRDPLTRKLLKRLGELDSGHAGEFSFIEDHLDFIKNLRDLYRLKVAAQDTIDAGHLLPVAASMGYGISVEAAETLYSDFIERTGKAYETVELLMSGM